MRDVRFTLLKLEELMLAVTTAETLFGQAALFAANENMVKKLEENADLNSFAQQKLEEYRWHIAAALGFTHADDESAQFHLSAASETLNQVRKAVG